MTAFALRILRRAAPGLLMIRLDIQLPPHSRALGRDLTDLGARRRAAGLAGRHALEVVAAAAVRVVDRVHGHTTDTGPADAAGLHEVEFLSGLDEGLVAASAAGHEADGGARKRVDVAELARREADDGLLLVVADDLGRGPGGAAQLAAVVRAALDVEDRGAFRDLGDDGHVARLDLRRVREG